MPNINDPVNMYYDLDLVNTDFSENGQIPARLTFTEVRASPILMNPQDYFFSIVRFQLDTAGAMPLFIPQIDLKQEPNQFLPGPPPPAPQIPNPNYSPDFPNKTVYEITMNYISANGATSVSITKPVIYVPHFTTAVSNNIQSPPTTAPLTINAITQNYFWVGSYAWWIRMLNKTISDIWAAMITAVGAAVPALPAAPPFLKWDDTLNSATLIVPSSLFNQGEYWNPYVAAPPYHPPTVNTAESSPANMNIFFNTPLHTLFSSFEYVFNNFVNVNKTNYMLRCYSKNGTNYYPAATITPAPVPPFPYQSWDALFMKQLYGTGSTMCPISSLIFETSLMPIVPQMIGLPKIFTGSFTATGTQAIQSGQNNNLSNEITDIVEPLNRGDEYFPNVLYLPQAEYRLIDLQGNGPVSSIQISVKWKDVYGIYHDFFLQNGCGASMKILFRQKAFNNISSS
jgi:hypothetical protein